MAGPTDLEAKSLIFEWHTHPDLLEVMEKHPKFSSAFATWIADPETLFRIGQVPEAVAAHLGAETTTVFLSKESYSKQLDHHAEVRPDHYVVVPVMFLDGEAYDLGKSKIQFVWEAGTLGFEATIKVTIKKELYLVSFFKVKRKRIENTRRKYRRVQ